MRITIRLLGGPLVQRNRDVNLRLALAVAALLTPAAVMAGVLAVWGLAAEFDWTTDFPITSGPLAQWPLWLALALVLQLSSIALNRYVRRKELSNFD